MTTEICYGRIKLPKSLIKKGMLDDCHNQGNQYCEDCGDHSALVCPKCDERFDHVWGPTFRIKKES